MTFHLPKKVSTRAGKIFERIVEDCLESKKVIFERQLRDSQLDFIPDIVIYDQKGLVKDVIFVTHSTVLCSKNKFWETLYELANTKLTYRDAKCILTLFGSREGWQPKFLDILELFFDGFIFTETPRNQIIRLLGSIKAQEKMRENLRPKLFATIKSSHSKKMKGLWSLIEKWQESLKPIESAIEPPTDTFVHRMVIRFLRLSDKAIARLEKLCNNYPIEVKRIDTVLRELQVAEAASISETLGGFKIAPATEIVATLETKRFCFADVMKLRDYFINAYPKLRTLLKELKDKQIVEKKVNNVLAKTNNFRISEERISKAIKEYKGYNWLLEVALAIFSGKPTRLAVEINERTGERLFSLEQGFRFTDSFSHKQASWLAKLIKEKMTYPIEIDSVVEYVRYRRYEQIRRNWKISPLRVMTAWKLAQSNIKYVGMPEKEYVFYDTLLTDMVGGGNVAYFFEVFLDNGKRILIHTKSAHGEVSHRKKEFAGHALFTLFRRQYDKFVRRNDVEEMVLVLDGTWRGTPDPYSNIRPLYYFGFTRIFYPQPLDEEWDLVKYLLKKGALVERESR